MGLNETPSADRVHIGFFGCRNAGKSSLVNAVTGQELAVVSDIKGTTTDPVIKAMEILPLGPVVIIDTPGYDDEGILGEKRIQKTKQILAKTDIAVLVIDAAVGKSAYDEELISAFKEREIPYIIAVNKSELCPTLTEAKNTLYVSAAEGTNINTLKERMARLLSTKTTKPLISDLITNGDTVVLVIPIDEAAPKGRIILPQQQVLRDILDVGGIAVVTKETELRAALSKLSEPPRIVVTDSQAFEYVSSVVPNDIELTSFSILMARYKGFLDTALKGITAIDNLREGDTVLIAEGCTHHRQCSDIGTVKIPRWLQAHTGSKINIKTCSGREFPEDLSEFKAVIHCGGCMLNEREVQHRMKSAAAQGIPFVNYGILIAHITGILKRSIHIFGL